MAELEQDLGLRIDSALQAVAQLDRVLTQTAERAGQEIADELAAAMRVDASPLEQAITGAVESADTDVEVEEVDAGLVTETIGEATEAADTNVAVESTDASAVTSEIEDAVEGADTSIEVDDVDAGAVTAGIESAIDGADTSVTVDDADASAVTEAIEDAVEAADTSRLETIGADASAAGGGLDSLAGSMGGLTGASENLDLATAALGGSFGGLATKAGPAGIAIGALAAAAGLYVSGAIETVDVNTRFADTFGRLAGQIEQVDIGGLNISIADLAVKLGASDDAIRQNAVNLGILGRAAGASDEEIARTAEQIIGLSARASALNPTLGTTEQVMGALSNGLARGGRLLAQYGITLTAAEIEARALADTGKTSARELTQYEKAAAGAALATEELGSSIGTAVEKGSKQLSVQLASLKTRIGETLEALGGPLVNPIIKLFTTLTPLVDNAARIIGTALGVLTPIIDGIVVAFEILEPVVGGVATAFEFLAPALKVLVPILIAMTGPIGLVVSGFTLVTSIFGKTKEGAKDVEKELGDLDGTLNEMPDSIAKTASGVDRLATSIGGMSSALVPVPELVRTLAQEIEVSVPGIGAAFEKASEDSQVSLMELQVALQEQIKAEREFFANLSYIIAAGGNAIAEELASQGPQRGAAAAKAIADATPAQVKALNAQAEELKRLEFERGQEISTRLAEGQAVGIQTAIEGIKGQFFELGKQPGLAFTAGAAAGIKAGEPAVVGAAGALGTAASQRFSRTLDVRSPSRVAMDIAAQFGAGVVIGLEQSIPAVELAADRLGSALIGAVSSVPTLGRVTVGGPSAVAAAQPQSPAVGVPVAQTINVFAAEDPEATAQRVSLRTLQGAQR